MKHAIACLNTQIGILLHNASVFHGEGREEDRDLNIAEADDLRMAVETLRDEGSGIEPGFPKFTGTHTPSAPDTLTIEAGKRYVRRDGGITEPLESAAGNFPDFVFLDPDSGETYQTDGRSGFGDDIEWHEDIVAEYVEPQSDPGTDATQFRLLASFVGSKATSHTEIVSDTVAEIRALRVSLEAERRRTLEAERKCRELEFRDYRFLNVGEKLEFTDQYSPGDGTWHPVEDSEGTVGRDEEWKYRRPWNGYPGYRMLGAGEMLRQGDEFRSITGGWGRVIRYGSPVNKTQLGRYRRPVNPESERPVNPESERPVEETPKQEQEYRMLEVGEVTREGDEAHTDSGVWSRLTGYHLGQRINERGSYPVGYYRRPISLDTKPENPDTPAA